MVGDKKSFTLKAIAATPKLEYHLPLFSADEFRAFGLLCGLATFGD
jgi:hypothetical protein